MRALLIDPFAKTITEVEHTGDYTEIYKHIGADMFDAVRVDDVHVLYIDDDGLFKPDQHYFQWGPQKHLAGKALLLGCDAAGETVACTLPLLRVAADVHFYDKQPVYVGADVSEGYEDHPIVGRTYTIRSTSKFK